MKTIFYLLVIALSSFVISCGRGKNHKPVLELHQENILPVGSVSVSNDSSEDLEVVVDIHRRIIKSKESATFTKLVREIKFEMFILNLDGKSKAVEGRAHPNIVGTKITVKDGP